MLRPRWQLAMLHVSFAAMISVLGLMGVFSELLLMRVGGIALTAFSQLLWFVLLHECGHRTLFRRAVTNEGVGHVAGFLAMIPFYTWRDVHAAHHLWTGWKDLDPTTRAVAGSRPAGWRVAVINGAWRLRVPLFGLIYRLSNFWNPKNCRRGALWGWVSIAVTALPWPAIIFFARDRLGSLLLSHVVFLALFETIMLSQHTHIRQDRAAGQRVSPKRPSKQVTFTRSLAFPGWFARWFLLNFNEHERHHAFPLVPGYYLHRLDLPCERKINWLRWWQGSHAIAAATLLFDDESRTGLYIE